MRDCPHSWENMSKPVMETKDEQEALEVCDLTEREQAVLMCEAANSAVLDSACTRTVTI